MPGVLARIGTMQMKIEEAESEGNYIPEYARICGIKTTTDMVNRTGRMKYLKMASSSNREFIVCTSCKFHLVIYLYRTLYLYVTPLSR